MLHEVYASVSSKKVQVSLASTQNVKHCFNMIAFVAFNYDD